MARLAPPGRMLPIALAALVAACAPSGSTVTSSPSRAAPPVPPLAASTGPSPAAAPAARGIREYDVRPGTHPHDVYPAADGGVWFTGQRTGVLGYLDPATGEVDEIPLGAGSAPHGVIVGPDGAPWITDGGLNAIVRVDPVSRQVRTYPLPPDRPGA